MSENEWTSWSFNEETLWGFRRDAQSKIFNKMVWGVNFIKSFFCFVQTFLFLLYFPAYAIFCGCMLLVILCCLIFVAAFLCWSLKSSLHKQTNWLFLTSLFRFSLKVTSWPPPTHSTLFDVLSQLQSGKIAPLSTS